SGGAFLEMFGAARAWNRHNVRRPGQRPGDGERRWLHRPRSGERQIGRQAVAVAPPVEPLKARAAMTEIPLVERLGLLEEAAEIAASDRRERDHDRPGLGAGLNEPELGIARPANILIAPPRSGARRSRGGECRARPR